MNKIFLAVYEGVGGLSNQLSPLNTNNADVSGLGGTIATNLIKVIVLLFSIAAVLSLIYGGFLYITAGGAPEKAETGKRVIMYSVVAIIIVILSYAIYEYVIKFLMSMK